MDEIFDPFEIGSRIQIEDQARQPGFGRITFPHTSDTVTGKLSDDGIDEIVWNIKGNLVPRHGVFL